MRNQTEDTLRVASQRNKEAKEEQKIQYDDASGLRLLRIIEKKMATAFIGALARFETYFGQLWGHGKAEAELTPNERAWRARWEQARQEILNNGNNQVRSIQQEISLYTIHWNKYQATLKPQEPKD